MNQSSEYKDAHYVGVADFYLSFFRVLFVSRTVAAPLYIDNLSIIASSSDFIYETEIIRNIYLEAELTNTCNIKG